MQHPQIIAKQKAKSKMTATLCINGSKNFFNHDFIARDLNASQ
jgi:hypothetical protein